MNRAQFTAARRASRAYLRALRNHAHCEARADSAINRAPYRELPPPQHFWLLTFLPCADPLIAARDRLLDLAARRRDKRTHDAERARLNAEARAHQPARLRAVLDAIETGGPVPMLHAQMDRRAAA